MFYQINWLAGFLPSTVWNGGFVEVWGLKMKMVSLVLWLLDVTINVGHEIVELGEKIRSNCQTVVIHKKKQPRKLRWNRQKFPKTNMEPEKVPEKRRNIDPNHHFCWYDGWRDGCWMNTYQRFLVGCCELQFFHFLTSRFEFFDHLNYNSLVVSNTPPKTNMEPKNDGFS